MQTKDDGKHAILPVAGAILDHARMPVMLPRQSDGDMRRDGSTTAQTAQPAVDERGRLHGASGLAARRRIGPAASRAARRIAQQRKFGYPGEQERKMAGKRKATPIKRPAATR